MEWAHVIVGTGKSEICWAGRSLETHLEHELMFQFKPEGSLQQNSLFLGGPQSFSLKAFN